MKVSEAIKNLEKYTQNGNDPELIIQWWDADFVQNMSFEFNESGIEVTDETMAYIDQEVNEDDRLMEIVLEKIITSAEFYEQEVK